MPNIDSPPRNHNPKLADRLEVFRARCWARAVLVEEGLSDYEDSLLILHIAALDYGLYELELADRIIAEEFGS